MEFGKENTKLEQLQKKLPNSLWAEKSILGCLLSNNKFIKDLLLTLSTKCFYSKPHQHIYEAIIDLHKEGIIANIASVGDRLKKKRNLKKVGGEEYLKGLIEKVTNSEEDAIDYNAKLVKDSAMLRDMIIAGLEIQVRGRDATETPSDILKDFKEKIDTIGAGIVSEDFSLKKEVNSAIDELEDFAKNDGVRIMTGFKDIDKLLGSIRRKRLYMFGALPSMGKTSFLIYLAYNILMQGRSVLYVTVEMSNREILFRLMSALSQVPNEKFENPKLFTGDDWSKVAMVASEVTSLPFYLNDNCYTVGEIYPLVAKYKPAVTIVDFIDTMDWGDVVYIVPKIAKAVSEFKRMAKTLNTAMIIASQVDRQNEGKHISKYQLSDLKGSGGKEIGADVVLFGVHPWKEKTATGINCPYTGKPWQLTDRRRYYINIKKNKYMKMGIVLVNFLEEYGIFRDWSYASQEEK